MTKRPADAPADSLPLDAIRVGKRFRQHMGDIDALAASIGEHGLLHPIVVTPERLLIAGERRLLAVRQLGWPTVRVTVVAPRDLLGAEAAENRDRLNFTPSEAVAIAEALRPAVVAAAKERQGSRTDLTSAKSSQKSRPARTDEHVAAAVGMSAPTLAKAAAVVAAVEADPELAPIADEMDRTGNIDRAFRQVQRPEPDHAAIMATAPVDERTERAYRWNKRLGEASATLLGLGYAPTLDMSAGAIVPTLDAEERDSTETYLSLMESWIANTRHVLKDTGVLHVVGGRA